MREPSKTKRAPAHERESPKQGIRESEQAESERNRAPESLRESREFFKAIIQHASDIILVVDKLGAITYASPSIERFLGYGPDELIGKSSLNLIVSEDKPRAMKDFGEALQTKETIIPNVFRIRHKNGTERTLEGFGKNLLDDPIVAGFVMNIRDITDRKRVEEALLKSEDKFRTIFDRASDGILIADAVTKKFLQGNTTICSMLGYTKEEIENLTIDDIHPPNDINRVRDEFEKQARGEKGLAESLPILRKDGTIFYADINSAPTTIGGIQYLVGVFRDMTEQKRARDEIAILAETGRVIGSTLEIDEVFERIDAEIRKLIPFDNLIINLFNAQQQTLEAAYISGLNLSGRRVGDSVPIRGTVWEESVRTRRGVIVQSKNPEELIDKFPSLAASVQAGIRSVMNIPLISKGEMIGNLIIRSKKPLAYTEGDLHLAEKIGMEIAGAITNARLFSDLKKVEEEQRRNREDAERLASETAIIAEIGRIVTSTVNIEEVYERFAEEVQKIIPFDRIVINSINVEMDTAFTVYMAGQGIANRQIGVSYPLKGSGSFEMVHTKSSLLIQTEDFDEYKDHFPGLLSTFRAGFRSIMDIPLFSKGEIVGGLLLRSFKPYAYTNHDVRLAERVGSQIAGAIANAKLFADLKKTEMSLRESEGRFRSLFEQAAVGVAEIETGTGRFFTVNRRLCEMVGRTEEELLAATFHMFTHPEDLNLHEENTALLLDGRIGRYSLEKRYLKKDEETVWVNITVSPLWKPGETPDRNMIVVEDITERKKAEKQLQHTLESLRAAVNTTIQVMVSAVETRDPYTSGHQLRSADLARAIATEMKLPQGTIDAIRMAGSIHDIGKLSIPAEILSKPTRLSNIEFSLIKEHSRRGFEMLKDVESPWPLAEIVYQHHERMDGSGYPRNLKGEEILMEARILAVADVVEAMASHRPYRPGLGIDAALNEIEKNRGVFYDAAVTDACLRLFREKGLQLAET